MTFPILAAALGAALIVLQMVLKLNTGLHRAATSIGVGTGGDLHLERKMRRHGNLAENAAIFVIVLALTEMYAGSTLAVAAFAAAFALARLSHALGFASLSGSHDPKGNPFFAILRAGGAFATAFSGIGLGGYLLYLLATRGELARTLSACCGLGGGQ